jgi:predicted HicB family RNase H-like nuclease/lambda repressor-like predicted transcriptional regulator
MGAEPASRSRRLLTFRLDRELRQRLRARLAGEGRTMSEVVILGLQMYVQHSARFTGSAGHDAAATDPGGAVVESTASAVTPRQAASAATTGQPVSPEQDASPEQIASPEQAASPEQVTSLATAEPDVVPVLADPEAGDRRAGERKPGRPTTVVASAADLALPDHLADYLCSLRECGHSDLLSATLARLHDAGWPLRPLSVALGISRQAVQARICQQFPPEVAAQVVDVPPPSAFPRRRPALPSGRRPHLTVKIDQALRAAAHRQALHEGSSLSQVVEKILDYYLRHGMPTGEIELGDTTPTRPAPRRRHRQHAAAHPQVQDASRQ